MGDPLEGIQAELHEIKKAVNQINGTVKRNHEEIFGSRAEEGLTTRVRQLEDIVLQGRTAVKVIVGIVALVGIGNIIALVTLAARLGG